MTIFVNAEPLHQGADFAIWRGEDIPPGVMRGRLWRCAADALADASVIAGGHNDTLPQTATDVNVSRKYGLVAAVAYTQMQGAQQPSPLFVNASGPRIIDADELYAPDLSKVDVLRARMMLQPDTGTQRKSSDRLLAASMSAAFEERRPKPSDAARAAWSRELRRLTTASEERERNRVLVDLEFEPWE